jgi:hypothetical protein
VPESDGLMVAVISQRQHRRERFSIKGEPSSRRRQLLIGLPWSPEFLPKTR